MISLPMIIPDKGATFISPLAMIPVGGVIFEVGADYSFRDEDGTVFDVLKGYRTDFESGPQLVKDAILPANNLRQWAAGLHDALYQAGIDKDYADSVYARALLSLPIEKISEWVLYEAVHLLGRSSWSADQSNLVEKAQATSHLRIELP